jgi:hypothetical protein
MALVMDGQVQAEGERLRSSASDNKHVQQRGFVPAEDYIRDNVEFASTEIDQKSQTPVTIIVPFYGKEIFYLTKYNTQLHVANLSTVTGGAHADCEQLYESLHKTQTDTEAPNRVVFQPVLDGDNLLAIKPGVIRMPDRSRYQTDAADIPYDQLRGVVDVGNLQFVFFQSAERVSIWPDVRVVDCSALYVCIFPRDNSGPNEYMNLLQFLRFKLTDQQTGELKSESELNKAQKTLLASHLFPVAQLHDYVDDDHVALSFVSHTMIHTIVFKRVTPSEAKRQRFSGPFAYTGVQVYQKNTHKTWNHKYDISALPLPPRAEEAKQPESQPAPPSAVSEAVPPPAPPQAETETEEKHADSHVTTVVLDLSALQIDYDKPDFTSDELDFFLGKRHPFIYDFLAMTLVLYNTARSLNRYAALKHLWRLLQKPTERRGLSCILAVLYCKDKDLDQPIYVDYAGEIDRKLMTGRRDTCTIRLSKKDQGEYDRAAKTAGDTLAFQYELRDKHLMRHANGAYLFNVNDIVSNCLNMHLGNAAVSQPVPHAPVFTHVVREQKMAEIKGAFTNLEAVQPRHSIADFWYPVACVHEDFQKLLADQHISLEHSTMMKPPLKVTANNVNIIMQAAVHTANKGYPLFTRHAMFAYTVHQRLQSYARFELSSVLVRENWSDVHQWYSVCMFILNANLRSMTIAHLSGLEPQSTINDYMKTLSTHESIDNATMLLGASGSLFLQPLVTLNKVFIDPNKEEIKEELVNIINDGGSIAQAVSLYQIVVAESTGQAYRMPEACYEFITLFHVKTWIQERIIAGGDIQTMQNEIAEVLKRIRAGPNNLIDHIKQTIEEVEKRQSQDPNMRFLPNTGTVAKSLMTPVSNWVMPLPGRGNMFSHMLQYASTIISKHSSFYHEMVQLLERFPVVTDQQLVYPYLVAHHIAWKFSIVLYTELIRQALLPLVMQRISYPVAAKDDNNNECIYLTLSSLMPTILTASAMIHSSRQIEKRNFPDGANILFNNPRAESKDFAERVVAAAKKTGELYPETKNYPPIDWYASLDTQTAFLCAILTQDANERKRVLRPELRLQEFINLSKSDDAFLMLNVDKKAFENEWKNSIPNPSRFNLHAFFVHHINQAMRGTRQWHPLWLLDLVFHLCKRTLPDSDPFVHRFMATQQHQPSIPRGSEIVFTR